MNYKDDKITLVHNPKTGRCEVKASGGHRESVLKQMGIVIKNKRERDESL